MMPKLAVIKDQGNLSYTNGGGGGSSSRSSGHDSSPSSSTSLSSSFCGEINVKKESND